MIKGGAIDMNAQLESSTLQFETLMGSSEKARKHVEGLFDFAAKTPFESGPIIEASRIMETFGGSALNSKDNLTTFGNAAAATGNQINEVGFWASRAYADIQAGRPFGEAAARLTEMGVITPQVRNKLEAMQKEGAKGPAIWGELTGAMGRFDGAMDKQAGTFDGMMSSLMDNVNLLLAKGMKPLFDGLKGLLGWLNSVMSSDAFNGGMAAAADILTQAFATISAVLGTLWKAAQPVIDFLAAQLPAVLDVFNRLAGAIRPVVDALSSIFDVFASGDDVTAGAIETFDNLGETLGNLASTIQGVYQDIFKQVATALKDMAPAVFDALSEAIDVVVALAPEFLDEILNFIGEGLMWIMDEGVPLAAEALAAFAQEFMTWIGPAAEQLGALLPVIGEKLINFIAEYGPIIAGRLIEWAIAFLGWVVTNVLPKLPGILFKITTVLLGWLAGVAVAILSAVAQMGMDFLASIAGELGKVPGKVMGYLEITLQKVLIWAGIMVKQAIYFAKQFVSQAITFISQMPGKIMTFLGQLPGMITGWGSKIATAAGNAARDFVTKFISALSSLPGKILNTVRDAFRSININVGPFHITGHGVTIDLPKIDIPGFASGSWSVPFTGPALVHQGEMIIPADLASRLRGGQGMGTGSPGGYGGGGPTVIVNIGDFHGTEDNIRRLSERLGEEVRYATLRRNG